jgi:hypothetical protein
MEARPVVNVTRAGKTSVWTAARTLGRHEVRQSELPTTQPPSVGVSTLDSVRAVFWQAYRYLFPPHALAAQTPSGSIVISWSIAEEPGALHPYAAPVMLRFDSELMEAMVSADPGLRVRIAEKHEATLREGLRGYDPFARFPNARVIVIG